jgi:NTE family protein
MSVYRSNSVAQNMPVSLEEPVTLLLLGGGIRFPALVGAVKAVEDKGIKVNKIVGSSTGSIVGSLYATGMSPDELRREVIELDTSQFKDVSLKSMLFGKGICAGTVLEEWLDAKLAGRRFADDFKVPIQVLATDILNYRPVIFSAASHPGLRVSTAARFSSGVPWVFECRTFVHDGKEHVFVDGSLMAGSIEESYGRHERVLILKVVSKRSLKNHGGGKLTLARYFREMLNFSLHAMEKEFIKGARWKDTILLYCSEIEPARFSLTTGEKEYLLAQGYEQTMKFLEYKWGI